MSQQIRTIAREAADTSKGYTLQKLRTITLILKELASNNELDFLAAIEFNGDVYIENSKFSYIEENKAYDSGNFTFASQPIKNTMVYFLDHWLKNEKNSKIRFGVYATNNIAKEEIRGRIKTLDINLPSTKIIESLQNNDYTDPLTLMAAKSLILDEYKYQYEHNKDVKLDNSYYRTLTAFSDEEWKEFFKAIKWIFNDTPLEDLETEIIDQINKVTFITSDQIPVKAPFIRAELFYQLELKQTKEKSSERMLTRKDAELIFYRAVYEKINDNSYKYLSLDYTEVQQKTATFLKEFIDLKYFSITGLRKSPALLRRDVLFYDQNIKLAAVNADDFQQLQPDSIKGSFGSLVKIDKPIFLFGELGSGKSSIVADYCLNLLSEDMAPLPIFIPSSYLHQTSLNTLLDVKIAINKFVNNELQLKDPIFDLDTLFKTRKETIIIIDGIDELELKTARQLIKHLKNLKTENDFVRIIATGRPVELEGIVPSGWHTLCTIPLNEEEIISVLYNEAINNGLSKEEASVDSEQRIEFLKRRPELVAVATTPLIICAIRYSLYETIGDKSLGDILYDALLHKLDWSSLDNKSDDFSDFNIAYPSVFNKEPILGALAWKIYWSKNRAINDLELNSLMNQIITITTDKPKIVTQAIKFFKNNFLQETSEKYYAFISAPLLECAAGLSLAIEIKLGTSKISLYEHWRCLSFALAITRRKGESAAVEKDILQLMEEYLTWPNNLVSQMAIILAEFKVPSLCREYFKILDGLQFRPFRIINQNDNISINSFAICIKLAEDSGYSWFWNNYLSPQHPLINYETELAADILTQYLLIQDFQIDNVKKQQLEDLVLPNLAFPSSFCFQLLPVIATIASSSLSARQRYLLLAGSLSKPALKTKVKDILTQEYSIATNDILGALDTICAMRSGKEVEAAQLYLQLGSGKDINWDLLETILGEGFPTFLKTNNKVLESLLDNKDLEAFLRYCIISENRLAKTASIYLFLSGEQDFKLIGPTLVTSIDWLDHKNFVLIDKIQDFVRAQNADTIASLIKNIPKTNHLGVPPAYWRIFLPAIRFSDVVFTEEFLEAIGHMSLFILVRYPEIRTAFSDLFKDRIDYKVATKDAMFGLDSNLRYLCAALLLTVNPQTDYEALEIVVTGMKRSSDMDEWQTFCLALDYGDAVISKLYDNLKSFIGEAKVCALLILHRNNYSITPDEKTELIKGLLGDGYYIDNQGRGLNVKYHLTLSQTEYIKEIIPYLNDKNLDIAERAADILFQFHLNEVNKELKAKIYLLYAEKYESTFFKLTINNENLLADQSFNTQLEEEAKNFENVYQTVPVLWLFFQAVKGNGNLGILLQRLLQKNQVITGMELGNYYEWLINIRRRYPKLETSIKSAVQDLLSMPAIFETRTDNFAWLKLMENEFCTGSDMRSGELQTLLPFTDEEVFVSLYFRKAYRKDLKAVNIPKPSFMPVFSKKKSEPIVKLNTNELDRFLVDFEEIPNELGSKIESVLLNGNYEISELDEIEKRGLLASYFATVIKFCRKEHINAELFPKSRDIGSYSAQKRDQTEHLLNILYRIYRILVTEQDYKTSFINGLLKQMEDENDKNYLQHFRQLLVFGYTFSNEQIIQALIELNNNTYELRIQFAFELSAYLADKIPNEEKDYYIIEFNKLLLSNRNHFSKSGPQAQHHLYSWILSLFLLYAEEKVTENNKLGFLSGLQYCFLEKNSMERALLNQPTYYFQAGDLLNCTYPLLHRIKPELIKEIVDFGANTNIPEIRATCKVLSALGNNLYHSDKN